MLASPGFLLRYKSITFQTRVFDRIFQDLSHSVLGSQRAISGIQGAMIVTKRAILGTLESVFEHSGSTVVFFALASSKRTALHSETHIERAQLSANIFKIRSLSSRKASLRLNYDYKTTYRVSHWPREPSLK